jgi:CRP/FNR family cyclic AMP-dependent transcriptional regulator
MSTHTDMLKKVSLFANVEEGELERLSSMLVERFCPRDTNIVSRDEPGDSMFVILKGRVKIVILGDNGREVILNLLKAGDFFGEMALLDDQPRSANVVAAEDSTVLILKRDAFAEHIKKSPATALNMMAELARRLRRADELISNLALLDVYARVAHILIDLAKRDGEEVEEGILIRERPTQQDIASMIGTSRETVSRVLSEFQRRGFVEMRGRDILLSRKLAGVVSAQTQDTAATED